MKKGTKGAILLALVGMFVLALTVGASAAVSGLSTGMNSADKATGGGLEAAAVGTLGDTTTTPPFTKVLDLPALNVDRDAMGRIVMDLPGLKLVSRPHGAAGAGAPAKLPKTGANVGDLFAAGMAALSTGGVLARRLKLSLAS
jgi:LPXTG-motif cell wall-anchored protein